MQAPAGATALLLGACTAADDGTRERANIVPEAVVALAAPYQDVQSARLRPEDGCYWYLHTGPVETTLLPLRTVEGRAICAASGAAPAS